jgi:hypothetical protein
MKDYNIFLIIGIGALISNLPAQVAIGVIIIMAVVVLINYLIDKHHDN